jgi:hypothetical protein
VLVVFEGACVGAFAHGAGPFGNDDDVDSAAGEGGGGGNLAPWDTMTVAPPVESIVAGEAIVVVVVVVVVVAVVVVAVVVVVVVVSLDVVAGDGVGGAFLHPSSS